MLLLPLPVAPRAKGLLMGSAAPRLTTPCDDFKLLLDATGGALAGCAFLGGCCERRAGGAGEGTGAAAAAGLTRAESAPGSALTA